jgi:hypothetical protein
MFLPTAFFLSLTGTVEAFWCKERPAMHVQIRWDEWCISKELAVLYTVVGKLLLKSS